MFVAAVGKLVAYDTDGDGDFDVDDAKVLLGKLIFFFLIIIITWLCYQGPAETSLKLQTPEKLLSIVLGVFTTSRSRNTGN